MKTIVENGAIRHQMSREELTDLYRKLENFIADCTQKEVDDNIYEIKTVQTMIHQRMRNSSPV